MSPTDEVRDRSTYVIRNVATGKVIDLNLNGRKKVTAWTFNGGLNQMWTTSITNPGLYRFYNDKLPGDDSKDRRYLQYDTGGHVDSVKLNFDEPKTLPHATWFVRHSPTLEVAGDNTRFEISYTSKLVFEHNTDQDGSLIQLRPSNSSKYQMWTFEEVWPQAGY